MRVVGGPQGLIPGNTAGQVPGAEADQRVNPDEAGDNDLADFAFRYGLAVPGRTISRISALIEDHAFEASDS